MCVCVINQSKFQRVNDHFFWTFIFVLGEEYLSWPKIKLGLNVWWDKLGFPSVLSDSLDSSFSSVTPFLSQDRTTAFLIKTHIFLSFLSPSPPFQLSTLTTDRIFGFPLLYLFFFFFLDHFRSLVPCFFFVSGIYLPKTTGASKPFLSLDLLLK